MVSLLNKDAEEARKRRHLNQLQFILKNKLGELKKLQKDPFEGGISLSHINTNQSGDLLTSGGFSSTAHLLEALPVS